MEQTRRGTPRPGSGAESEDGGETARLGQRRWRSPHRRNTEAGPFRAAGHERAVTHCPEAVPRAQGRWGPHRQTVSRQKRSGLR